MPKQVDVADHLRKLAELLSREAASIVTDTGPLQNAFAICKGRGKKKPVEYIIDGLIFRITNTKDSVPEGLTEANLRLDVLIKENKNYDEDEDPLAELTVEIEISAKKNNKVYFATWHLDRHIEGGEEPEFMHPCYHIHFGGYGMGADKGDFGQTLLLSSPRLAHPPLDAILAIDFVLTNFFTRDQIKFIESDGYRSIMREAQQWLWRPYILALKEADRNAARGESWDARKIWPQIQVTNLPAIFRGR
jgi:hypothetical protein